MHHISNNSFSPAQTNANQTPTSKQDAPSTSSQQTISQSQTSSLGGLWSLLDGGSQGGSGSSSQGSSSTSNWLSNIIGSWISDIFSQSGDSSSGSTTQTGKDNGGSFWCGTDSETGGTQGSTGSTGTSGTNGSQNNDSSGSTGSTEQTGKGGGGSSWWWAGSEDSSTQGSTGSSSSTSTGGTNGPQDSGSSSSSSSTEQTGKGGGSSWWNTGSEDNGSKGSTSTGGTSGTQDTGSTQDAKGSTSTGGTSGAQDTGSTQGGTGTQNPTDTTNNDDSSLMSYEDFVSSRFKSGEDTSIEAFTQYLSEEMGIPADNITVSADGQTISTWSTSADPAPELSAPEEPVLSDIYSQSGFAPERSRETLPNGDIQETYTQIINRQTNDGEAFNLDDYMQEMSERFNVPLENVSVNESNNTISVITNTISSDPSLSDVAQQDDTGLDDTINPTPVPYDVNANQTASSTQDAFSDIKHWW